MTRLEFYRALVEIRRLISLDATLTAAAKLDNIIEETYVVWLSPDEKMLVDKWSRYDHDKEV